LKKRAVGGMPEPYPLEKLFNISDEEWMEALKQDPTSSHSPVFLRPICSCIYFMHLDGKGDSQRVLRLLSAKCMLSESRWEDYRKAMEEFFKKPGVTLREDGSYTYRSDVQHPAKPEFIASPEGRAAFQKKTLGHLWSMAGARMN
jgi:hypothetical protein